jgi:4-hydroxy-tetrahydrodipicolinate synthase
MFKGSMVAVVTPMDAQQAIDIDAFNRLLEWQIDQGTSGLIVLGTTGESPTINEQERTLLIQQAILTTQKRVPVIVGVGSNCTAKTIQHAQSAQALGADVLLVVVPYYNKPTQAGLFAHFQAVHEATQRPIILYNVPGRTACDLLPETVGQLSQLERIVGIKEASGDLTRVEILRSACGEDFSLFSGDDASCASFVLAGGDGVISVTANVEPKLMTQMIAAALEKNETKTMALNAKLADLHQQLFVEPNPTPVKWALKEKGFIQSGIRLPLLSLTAAHYAVVARAMANVEVVGQ